MATDGKVLTNEFMLQLTKDLMEKRGVKDTTAASYVKTLFMLNGKKPFKNLTFLKKTADIMEKIKDYAQTTKRGILGSVVGVLNLVKDDGKFRKAHQQYEEEMNKLNKEYTETRGDTLEKTDKEDKNWIGWEEVLERKQTLRGAAMAFPRRALVADEWDTLLHFLLVSLYSDIQPRRNQDYQNMWVVKTWSDAFPKDRNYYVMGNAEFRFYKFKTSKSKGEQILAVPSSAEAPLTEALTHYLKYHPLRAELKKKTGMIPLLVSFDGKPLLSVNAITRALNKVFGKQVGSSMLRHSYLSRKYGETLKDMKADADAMAHSTATQQGYIRLDTP